RRIKATLVDGAFMEVRDGFLRITKADDRLEKDGKFRDSQRDKVKKRRCEKRANSLNVHNSADTAADTGAYTTPSPSPPPNRDSITLTPSAAPPPPAVQSSYAFEGKVIRLNQRDYDRWQKSYPAIPDLRAELQALDDYAASPGGEDFKRKWFFRTSAAL